MNRFLERVSTSNGTLKKGSGVGVEMQSNVTSILLQQASQFDSRRGYHQHPEHESGESIDVEVQSAEC